MATNTFRARNLAAKIRKTEKFTAVDIIILIGMIFLALICFIPFYQMLINSTHDNVTVTSSVPFTPGDALFDNWVDLDENTNIVNAFKNNIIVAVTATLIVGYVAAITAYGFSKYKFRGRKFLFVLLLASMMIPFQISLIGYYDIVYRIGEALGITGGLWSVIVPSFCNPQAVFLLTLYSQSVVPNSVVESARIDGSGEFRTFNSIVLPMLMPCVATVSIFSFVFNWNNMLVPMMVLNEESKTLPILIAEVKGVYNDNVSAQYLAVAISVIPVLAVFAFLSKFIIGGITEGAVKG